MATARKACKDQYASISNAEAPCKLGEERGRTGLTPLLHDLPYQIVVVAVWRTNERWGFADNTFECLFYSPHFVVDLIITNDNMRRLSGGIKEEKDKDGSVLWSNESCLKDSLQNSSASASRKTRFSKSESPVNNETDTSLGKIL